MDLTTKILDLSACYRRISAVFPYFPRLDFDFESWYEECVRRAIAAEDEKTYHLTLMAFLNRLGDGHTGLHAPQGLAEPGRLSSVSPGSVPGGVLPAGTAGSWLWTAFPWRNGRERMEKILPGRENFLYPGPFQAYLPLFLTGETHVLTTETGEESFALGGSVRSPTRFTRRRRGPTKP